MTIQEEGVREQILSHQLKGDITQEQADELYVLSEEDAKNKLEEILNEACPPVLDLESFTLRDPCLYN